jgi:hypothetical protein
MQEIEENDTQELISEWRLYYGSLLGALIFGVLLGTLLPSLAVSLWLSFVFLAAATFLAAAFLRMIFPKIVHVIRQVQVEVPVERIVVKEVMIPVDRIVEKTVEVPVIKYVSSDVLSGDDKPSYVLSAEVEAMWRQVGKGYNRREVIAILGKPDGPPKVMRGGYGEDELRYQWGKGWVTFTFNSSENDYLVSWVFIPPY